ncbi:M1 family metallopeptidase [Melioribacter sp. OK-6-Me]|uniref:M1 family metallopeptidase n=1 Tax=unclassified Melioribacter TaxID=2627329 RepID=UPI003EDAB8F5
MIRKLFIFTFISFVSTVFARSNSYDIKQYDLYIQPDFVNKSLFISTTIRVNNPALQDTFYFGLNDRYEMPTVRSNTSPVSVQRENGWIIVVLQRPAKNVTLVIETKGIIGKSDSENRQVITDSSLFLLWSDRFYPIDFTHWAKVKTTILLPDNFLAIAPGKLISTRKNGKMIEHTFLTTNPTVCFSVFADSRWIMSKRKINGITMQTLLYPESQKFLEQIFSTSSEILKFYSETYCAYPFDQFSFITLDSIYARRAFPGFVGYNPGYLKKEFTTTGFDAHETALLWWFYTMRGEGPGSFQWTEGFGDYAEFLYNEKYQKPIPGIFRYFREKYLSMPSQEDVFYYDLTGNTPQQIVHGKYPWLMHLIRYRVGDEKFREAMKLIFKKFRFRTFTMEEFIGVLEAGCGQKLQWWKQDWLERKGVPSITFKSEILSSDSLYIIKCIFTQVANLYYLPIEIRIETEKGPEIKKVNISERQAIFTFESREKPTNITIDPNNWLLMKIIELN